MKALVYHGPAEESWETVSDPVIQSPTDAIVRIDSATICGTDLHILKGDVPEVAPGTILGHEAVGTIVETGPAVTTFTTGDRVLISCITACGRCRFCKEAHYGLCTGGGGWIFGHSINGLQAEYARVPFADTSVYKVPVALTDEQVLFLADILPTAYEVGVLSGCVEPGDSVAIVGKGPIGLATIMTARLLTPSIIIAIDKADSRLVKAPRVRRDQHYQQLPTRPRQGDDGPDRKPRSRCCDRGSWSAGHFRARRRADSAGRPRCQHRRAWSSSDSSPGKAVDTGRDHNHRAGRYLYHPSAAQADRWRAA